MPNHITNIMGVSGPADELERFRKTVSVKDNPTLFKDTKEELEDAIKSNTATLARDHNNTWGKMNLKRSQDALKDLLDGKDLSVLDFNGTVPMPRTLRGTSSGSVPEEEQALQAENLKKYGYADWYSWSIANYGTKWGAYDVTLNIEKRVLSYRYNTAWSPPTAWLATTAELFPTLEFEDYWHDEGGGAGRITITDGTDVCEETIDDHDWYMDNDDGYRETYTFLTEGDYQEVINQYSKEGSISEYRFEEKLLDRIKDEDLILFTSFTWENSAAEESYKERLQGIPTPPPKRARKKKAKVSA